MEKITDKMVKRIEEIRYEAALTIPPLIFDRHAGSDPDDEYPATNVNNIWAASLLSAALGEPLVTRNGDWQQPPRWQRAGLTCLIFNLYTQEKMQRDLWRRAAQRLWDSDGHYGRDSREKFIADFVSERWISRDEGKRICDAL